MEVMYNGGKICHHGCTEPIELEKNRVYNVKNIIKKDDQKYLELEEVEGYFNSKWFDNLQTYLAISDCIPVIGKEFKCQKIIGNNAKLVDWEIPEVQDVIEMCGNLYEVHTLNSIYVVQVLLH